MSELKKIQSLSENIGVKIMIEKRIPMQAGLAGGSTDAAAVIRTLNQLFSHPFSKEILLDIASKCGSDTAYCIEGGTKWGEGTGSELSFLPQAPEMDLILVKPSKGVPTREAYVLFDKMGKFSSMDKDLWSRTLSEGNVEGVSKLMTNSLEDPAFYLVPEIRKLKDILLENGCLGALMSGSGSAVFGILPDRSTGRMIREKLTSKGFDLTWLVKTIV